MNFPFLDTNVLLRHLLDNDPDLSPRASAFLERVEAGEIRVEISETVVAEIVFTLERSYKFPKTAIHDALVKIIDIPGMHLPRSRIVREALRRLRPIQRVLRGRVSRDAHARARNLGGCEFRFSFRPIPGPDANHSLRLHDMLA